MDTALIVITLLSIGMTGALLVYASRLQREQREREEARVLALASDIRGPEADLPPVVFRERARALGAAPESAPARPLESDARVTKTIAAAPLSMFGAEEETASPARRLAIPAAGVVVVGLVLGGIYVVNARPAVPAAVKAASAPAASSLELVALRQARAGRTLTVSGVVRNPAGARALRGVTGVVFVFDKAGAFVTSARAPIDYQVLEPGDESPFTVAVPEASAAARYRVSFRTDRDVLPHVDVREGPGPAKAQGVKGPGAKGLAG